MQSCYMSKRFAGILHAVGMWRLSGQGCLYLVVWSFLLFGLFGYISFLLFGRGLVLLFAVWAQQKIKHAPTQTAKTPARTAKETRAPLPCPLSSSLHSELIFNKHVRALQVGGRFFAVWAEGVFYFLLFGRGVNGGNVGGGERGRVFFWLFGRAACFVCCCLGGGVFYVLRFAVWAGGVFYCLPFGWGRVCFFAVWAGTGVHSLTDLPGRALRGLTTKKTQQQKKMGSRLSGGTTCHRDVGA